MIATVLGVTVFVAGQLSHNVLSLSDWSKNPLATILARVVFVFVPNLSAVDMRAAIVGEGSADWGSIGLWAVYLCRLRGADAGRGHARLPAQGVLGEAQCSPVCWLRPARLSCSRYQLTRPARRRFRSEGVRAVAEGVRLAAEGSR